MGQLIAGVILGGFLVGATALLFLQIGLNLNKSEPTVQNVWGAVRPIRPGRVSFTDELALEKEEQRKREAEAEEWKPGEGEDANL